MKKGFTLIEMLGVLIILSILGLLVSGVIINRVKEVRKELESQAKDIIISSTREKVETESDTYIKSPGTSYCISYSTLISDKYLSDKMIPSIDEIEYLKLYMVKVRYSGDVFSYEVVKECTPSIEYVVNLDSQSGTGGTATITASYGTSMPTVTTPAKTGYIFDGFYSATSGGGTKYYDADGVGVKNYDLNAGTTLYANYTSQTVFNYAYTGAVQTISVPKTAWYKVELWGAQGGSSTSKGAYVTGKIYLSKGTIYLYVGEGLKTAGNSTSFNGGTATSGGWPGGGATDIRLVGGAWNDSTSINSRIMVAAGSGAGAGNSTTTLGAGGTLVGNNGSTLGGTQLTFGGSAYPAASFGISNGGCSGGNGYYPGGGAACAGGAGGGSSFISGYAGVNAITSASSLTPTYNTIHYSGAYFIGGTMQAGVNAGSGKATITYLGAMPAKTTTNLNSARFIKDCMNGSSANAGNHWVEFQAIKDGVNLAKGKTVTSASNITNAAYITDGDITPGKYAEAALVGLQCITIDLGQVYALDEIAVWHYWADSRTYTSNTTYVSADNSTWVTVKATTEVETANGKRVSAY